MISVTEISSFGRFRWFWVLQLLDQSECLQTQNNNQMYTVGTSEDKESGGLWECVFLLVLQYVVGANSSYASSCLMPLPRCSSKEDATSQKNCKKYNCEFGATKLIHLPLCQVGTTTCSCRTTLGVLDAASLAFTCLASGQRFQRALFWA